MFGLNSLSAQAPAGQTEITVRAIGNGGTFTNENGWELVDITTGTELACRAAGSSYPQSFAGTDSEVLNVVDGNMLELRVYDTFGDGWDGGNMNMEIEVTEDGSAGGCTTFPAGFFAVASYNPTGTDGTANLCANGPDAATGTSNVAFSLTCPACELTCPADVVLSADAGLCAATATVIDPVLSADCVGVLTTLTDGPIPYIFVANLLNPTTVTISNAVNSTTDVELVLDYNGDHGGATFEAFDFFGPDGVAVFVSEFSGADCSDGQAVAIIPQATWDGWITTFGTTLSFVAQSAATNTNNGINAFTCTNTFTLSATLLPVGSALFSHTVNGGAPINGNASGLYNVGVNTVCYQSVDAFGNTSECCFTITVTDDEDPMLTCPADQVINLAPGDCDAVIDYNVTFTENCPSAPFSVSANNTLTLGGTHIACSPGALNQHYQIFDLAALGFSTDLSITAVQVGLEAGGIVNGRIYEYTGNPAGPPALADLTLIASGTLNGTAGALNDIPVSATLTGGGLYVIEVEGLNFFLSYNDDGSNSLTYLSSAPCGIIEPATFASIGFGERDGVMGLIAEASIDLIQTAGLASGEAFPIGTTVNTFTVTDDAGNVGTCSFDVTVNEFANPISTLATNDQVQVSLDEDGCSYVTADMVLEGGPYGCYEDYELTRSPAYSGSCPVLANSVVVGCEDIGSTIIVTITDPDTGNSAWTTVTVEDKLDPIIDCGAPIEVAACDGQAPPNFGSAPAPIVVTGTSTDTGAAIDNTLDPATATASIAGIPGNAVVNGVTVSIQATHTWVGDLTLELTGPNGATITLIEQSCGVNDDIDIVFDDNGGLVTCSGGSPGMGGVVAPEDPLATYNDTNVNGTWTLTITDNVGGDNGTLDGFSVTVNASLPFVPAATATDNCDVDLTYVDNFFNLDCFDANGDLDFSGRIERTWTATDGSGNTATCVQIINLTRPSLANITFPEDITWQCSQFDAFPAITGATALNSAIVDVDAVKPSLNVSPTMSAANLATTGSGVPTVFGLPIVIGDLCELSCDYEDNEIVICPGTKKILRSWVCIDWCAGESVEFDQIVKVVDEVGPDLISPGDLEINVFSASAPAAGVEGDCKGNAVLPAIANNGDNCSSIVSYETQIFSVDAAGNADELLAILPTNGGQFSNIELYTATGSAAEYIVCYSATDECGNETVVCVDVTLFDKVPPVAICDEITQISITNSNANGNSCSSLAASTLDDGSYDNCTDVHFLVARMNNADPTNNGNIYTPFEDFCCSDIPGPVQVILLVMDDVAWDIYLNSYGQVQSDGQLGLRGARLDLTNDDGTLLDMDGRWNFCMVEVLVEDKLAPVVVCPANATLTCDEFADNLEVALLACDGDDACESIAMTAGGYGDVTAFDNCSVETTPTVTVTTDQCGVGSVVRSFSGVDPSGNASNVCTQVITITQVSDWCVE
ncbi:MAG: subtilisin-like proprotein convertase family protein, partial [Saprospiraceae bacterium]